MYNNIILYLIIYYYTLLLYRMIAVIASVLAVATWILW